MKDKGAVQKKWSSNLGRWYETLTHEQRRELGQRAARAEWGPEKAPLPKANDGPWVWPIDLE